ncbi:MAG TPA: hypothetical protein VIH18_32750 [Candidatus Binatia bacterium]|jgi:tripartite-type tricarboxylate transporter receptor subunit TctC
MRRFSRSPKVVFYALIILFPKVGNCQSLYYQGKTIKVVQGRNPGGVGDLRIKTILPFLQKYIPGNPIVVPEYMAGGGGRKVANYFYSNVKRDGLTIGASSPGVLAGAGRRGR